MEKLSVELRSPNARKPHRNSKFSAGADLFSSEGASIDPGHWKTIDTGVAVKFPDGCYGRVAPRSGLANGEHGIDVLGGVIDGDYTGTVKVILKNNSHPLQQQLPPFVVEVGDRIAQLICERCIYAEIEEVKDIGDCSGSGRGNRGLGSSGKR